MFEVHHNKDKCKKGINNSCGFITNLVPSLISNRTFFLSCAFSHFPCYMLIKAFLLLTLQLTGTHSGFAFLNLPPTPNKAGSSPFAAKFSFEQPLVMPH